MIFVSKDNAWGTLASGIGGTAGATALTLTAGHGARFPEIVAPKYGRGFLVNATSLEAVKIVAHSPGSDTLTLVRGASPQAFLANDRFELRTSFDSVVDMHRWLWMDRATNVQITAGDLCNVIRITAAVTQTFDTAANLGAGFVCLVINDHSASITLQCAGLNTINGAATVQVAAGASCWVICDGVDKLRTAGLVDISSKYDKVGGPISGAVTMASTLAIGGALEGASRVKGEHLQAINALDPGSGLLYLGNSGSRYLHYQASSGRYALAGGELDVNGKTVVNAFSSITLTGGVGSSGTLNANLLNFHGGNTVLKSLILSSTTSGGANGTGQTTLCDIIVNGYGSISSFINNRTVDNPVSGPPK